MASYGFQNNCLGILGEDTDYLIYDTCPYFSISRASLDSLDTVMLWPEKPSAASAPPGRPASAGLPAWQ